MLSLLGRAVEIGPYVVEGNVLPPQIVKADGELLAVDDAVGSQPLCSREEDRLRPDVWWSRVHHEPALGWLVAEGDAYARPRLNVLQQGLHYRRQAGLLEALHQRIQNGRHEQG